MSEAEWDELRFLLEKYHWDLVFQRDGGWVLSEKFAAFSSPEEILEWILAEYEIR